MTDFVKEEKWLLLKLALLILAVLFEFGSLKKKAAKEKAKRRKEKARRQAWKGVRGK